MLSPGMMLPIALLAIGLGREVGLTLGCELRADATGVPGRIESALRSGPTNLNERPRPARLSD